MGNQTDQEHQRLLAFQTLLDGSRTALDKDVEPSLLRRLCAQGIPEHPSHLRPLAYSLLLGALPPSKREWKRTARKQREKYYALVNTFMNELEAAPEPRDPNLPTDALLVRIAKDVERVNLNVLKAQSNPSKSSRLAAPADNEISNNDEPSSSSSSDEQPHKEGEDRAEGHKSRKRQPAPPLLSRRALFVRLDRIARVQQAANAPGVEKGKGKAENDRALVAPQIVLSPESSVGPESPEPAPKSEGPKTTPSLSLTLPDDPSRSQPPSPITLVESQPFASGPRAAIASASMPDTHAEVLIRLLFVFTCANPRWRYVPSFVEIIVPLYLIYAEAATGSEPKGRYPEEETYWAFTFLMLELGDVIAAIPGNDTLITHALERLSRRVRWADEPLWKTLKERNLDPADPLYTYQWISSLLTNDRRYILPVWDFLFSQPPASHERHPKLDLILDISVAMIVLLKADIMLPPASATSPKKTMWAGSGVADEPRVGEEDPEMAFIRCLQMFRYYPLKQVGGVAMVLNTAFELHQERVAASLSGEDPDSPEWAAARDAAANKPSWFGSAFRSAAQGASSSTARFWNQAAQSDTAASISKMTTNASSVSVVAAAKLQSMAPSPTNWQGISASRWWKSKGDDESISGEEFEHFGSLPSTPGNASPRRSKFISPEHRFSLPTTGAPGAGRPRSDSNASNSAMSVTSLQDKLSGLAMSLTTGSPRPETPKASTPSSGPRPLLLSSAARRASHGASNRSRGPSPQPGSPPHRHDDTGLYRIRSRNSVGRPLSSSKVASLADKFNRAGSDSDSTFTTGHTGHRVRDSVSTQYDSDANPHLAHSRLTSALAVPAPPATLAPPEPEEPPEPISIPTPQIAHLTEEDYEHVYEPAEDSFILLDALEADAAVLRDSKPTLCVEIGSGSGIASTFMGTILGAGEALLMSSDINKYAASATLRTGAANDVELNPVLANLLDPMRSRLAHQVDLLIFNPPYVETDEAEMTATQAGRDIGGAWAGGNFGMAVTNLVLEQLPNIMAPGGRFYLVAIHQNKPDEILARMRAAGFECKTVMKRRAGRELLSVLRMIAPRNPIVNGNGTGGAALQPKRTVPPAPSSVVSATETEKPALSDDAHVSPRRAKGSGHRVEESADLALADDEGGYGGLLDTYT